MRVVSDWAEYCAHCGHIEPENLEESIASDGVIGLVYQHKYNCTAYTDKIAHDMFVALWNAETHMKDNDVWLRRAAENIERAMKPFEEKWLSEDSHYVKCVNEEGGVV